ncbi:MAG: hypothetical protein ACPGTS_00570 [Minisyncoccia bacterium]
MNLQINNGKIHNETSPKKRLPRKLKKRLQKEKKSQIVPGVNKVSRSIKKELREKLFKIMGSNLVALGKTFLEISRDSSLEDLYTILTKKISSNEDFSFDLNSEKTGFFSELFTELVLLELKKQGKIISFMKTKTLGKADRNKIDFFIIAVSRVARLVIRLQVKSSSFWQQKHINSFAGDTVASIVASPYLVRMKNDLLKIISAYTQNKKVLHL